MKKIIPFKKNLNFKTNVNEITSISLEHNLHNNEYSIDGELIINGNYKVTETSVNIDDFEFKIPINIEIDKKYIIDNIIIDIDDFYYEIINNNILEVNVDVMLDNIIERPIIEQVADESLELIDDLREEIDKMNDEKDTQVKKIERNVLLEEKNVKKIEERCIETEEENIKESSLDVQSIIGSINETKEDYSTYCIYIVREGDTLDSIMTKYSITKEVLSEYNDLNELKLGDKIIIPELINVKN